MYITVAYTVLPYVCLELTPGWVVDVGMPHLLIAVQLLACLENALLALWGSSSGIEQLGSCVKMESCSSHTGTI